MWKKSSSPKIHIFVRHCHFSSVSAHKKRQTWFTRARAYDNFLKTLDSSSVEVTFFLDTHYPCQETHFVKNQTKYPVVEIDAGTESGSFLKLLDYVSDLSLDPETVVYFLEDDYIHKQGWTEILLEGFSLSGVDYVTLYDHRDKYFFPQYENLQSKVFCTPSSHWRTVPSTTNTFAVRFKTLMQHLDVHREFSLNRKITADHDKFCKLAQMGSVLVSPMPGWSTHAEPEFASPCIDWEKII